MADVLATIWQRVDPRLRASLIAEYERAASEPLPAGQRVVLVGQRAAGKSWLLEPLAQWLNLPGIDLDAAIERSSGRRILDWLPSDEPSFRAAERSAFLALPSPAVVSAGGGFLSLHGDLLEDQIAVLVPLTLETHLERLRADLGRPRWRPELTLEAELREVFHTRERLHSGRRTIRLPAFLKATARSGNGV